MLKFAAEICARLYARFTPTGRGAYRVARIVRTSRPRTQWRGTFVTPDHLTLDLDLAVYPDVCMAYGLYEIDTARLIQRLLQPGDRFVDAGANIGYFTLLAARCVGVTGRVDAFEPQPDNRARLLGHIARNSADVIVHVHPVALSDRAGEAVIHAPDSPDHNHGESSLFAPPDVKTKATIVPTVRMDALIRGAVPRLVKMDVEGAEPMVIEGMSELLRVDRPPAIIMEHNVPSLTAAGFAADEAVRRLLQMQPRYGVYRIGSALAPITATVEALAALPQINLLFTTEPIR